MNTISTIAMINFVENIFGKNDNFLLNYRRKQQKIKKKRWLLLQRKFKQNRQIITKNKDYFKTIKSFQADEFQSHFHMDHSTFELLQNSLKRFWTRTIRGRLGFSLEKCLYVTLWKLCKSNVTFGRLSRRFNIAKGSVHKIFYKTIKLICLLKNEIMWPSAAQQKFIMKDFQNSKNNPFVYVIGCIDGTHFNIAMPNQDADSYYKREGKYTVIMQGICDSKFRFIDVFIGCPGNCHAANVWRMSPIFKAITTSQVELAENAFILGDSKYPITKFLITPYTDNGHLTCEENQFNYCLSSTRVCIEQAYSILKNKFQILRYINLGSVQKASKVIYACTILHNFIINRENPEYNTENMNNDNNYSAEAHLNSLDHMEENNEDMDGLTIRKNLTKLCSSFKINLINGF